MAKGDLYDRLGVRRDASPQAVKRAYLRLAKKLHPDVNRTRDAHDRFLAVKEAYETLSSPLRRREYDEALVRRASWDVPRAPGPGRPVRVTAPYVANIPRSVRIRTTADTRRRRQLSFAYTAVTSGMSVVFLAGSFLLVALGGVVPGVVSFLMGLVLVLVLMHVIPIGRLK